MKILVVGDIILDKYVHGDVFRVSPEAPVPILKFKESKSTLGGAGNVANNLRNLGCIVDLVGIIGTDTEGELIKSFLNNLSIGACLISLNNFPTISKTRIISNGHQICRIDREEPHINNSEILDLIQQQEHMFDEYDALIISDYNKGLIDREVSQYLIKQFNDNNKSVIVDPKKKDWSIYHGASIITPNYKEFAEIAKNCSNSVETIIKRGRKIIKKNSLQNILVTRSEKGMLWIGKDHHINIEAEAKEVFDVSGAGDTVIATLSASLTNGFGVERSLKLANIAAGIVVGKIGTLPITIDELQSKVNNVSDKYLEISTLVSTYFKEGNEDFSLIISELEENSFNFVDILKSHKTNNKHKLFIVVHSDEYFERKFNKKPFFKASDKITLFSHLDFINGITLINNNEQEALINHKIIQP